MPTICAACRMHLRDSLLALCETGETVIDATLGLGGHAAAFVAAVGSSGHFFGLDSDRVNLKTAGLNLKAAVRELHSNPNITLYHSNFGSIAQLGLPPADVLYADLGLCSTHVDSQERGFSFRYNEAPLDMRFDQTDRTRPTASEWIASATEEQLAFALHTHGDIPLLLSAKIAREIWLGSHQHGALKTSADLKACVFKVAGFKWMAQVFQAIRIEVNQEMVALESLLRALPALVKPLGRVGIISYHSGEGRVVKTFMKSLCEIIDGKQPPFRSITNNLKAVTPKWAERSRNSRAESAVLRLIQKLPSAQ